MARTKQTEHTPTGGKAPRKQQSTQPNYGSFVPLSEQTGVCYVTVRPASSSSSPPVYILQRNIHEGNVYHSWQDAQTKEILVADADELSEGLHWKKNPNSDYDNTELRFGFERTDKDAPYYKIFFFDIQSSAERTKIPLKKIPPGNDNHGDEEWEVLVLKTGDTLRISPQPFHFFNQSPKPRTQRKAPRRHQPPSSKRPQPTTSEGKSQPSTGTKQEGEEKKKTREDWAKEITISLNWKSLVEKLYNTKNKQQLTTTSTQTTTPYNSDLAVNLVRDLYRRVTLGYMDTEKIKKFGFGSTVAGEEKGQRVGYQVMDKQFGNSVTSVLFSSKGAHVIRNLLTETKHIENEVKINDKEIWKDDDKWKKKSSWVDVRITKRQNYWKKANGYYVKQEGHEKNKKVTKLDHVENKKENDEFGEVIGNSEKTEKSDNDEADKLEDGSDDSSGSSEDESSDSED